MQKKKLFHNQLCHVRGKETRKFQPNKTDPNRIEPNERIQRVDEISFFIFWAFTFAFTSTVVTPFIVIPISIVMLTHIIHYFISCESRFSDLNAKGERSFQNDFVSETVFFVIFFVTLPLFLLPYRGRHWKWFK